MKWSGIIKGDNFEFVIKWTNYLVKLFWYNCIFLAYFSIQLITLSNWIKYCKKIVKFVVELSAQHNSFVKRLNNCVFHSNNSA